MNDADKIRNFLVKISEQYNRGTAAPYFYVIRTSVNAPAFEGCGDFVTFKEDADPEDTYDSVSDFIEAKKESLEYDEMLDVEKEEFNKRMENADLELTSYDFSKNWTEEGMFLTEEGANNHLASNAYRYSEDAHTYAKHSYRAPELKEFFVSLFRHFEVPRGNLDLYEIPNDYKGKQ